MEKCCLARVAASSNSALDLANLACRCSMVQSKIDSGREVAILCVLKGAPNVRLPTNVSGAPTVGAPRPDNSPNR